MKMRLYDDVKLLAEVTINNGYVPTKDSYIVYKKASYKIDYTTYDIKTGILDVWLSLHCENFRDMVKSV